MAPEPAATSFNDFVQAKRERRRNEEVANRLLGAGRRSSAPTTSLGARVNAAKGLPANRITKSSTPNRTVEARSLQRALGGITGITSAGKATTTSAQPAPARNASSGFSIKGRAGPYTVIAQNFLPGTTAADIEAAMFSGRNSEESGFVSCRLISSTPTVIAELVLSKESEAKSVIAKYNNKMADGRLLHVYLQNASPGTQPFNTPAPTALTADQGDEDMYAEESQNTEVFQSQQNDTLRYPPPPAARNAPTSFQDGRYGFPDTSTGVSSSSGGYNTSQIRDSNGVRSGLRSGLRSDDMITEQEDRPYRSHRPRGQSYRSSRGRGSYGYSRGY